MLIQTLNLQNFGIYKGNIELVLSPEKKWKNSRPVVLIGGKNGAGKSTIFEAIKLCLYGPKSLESRLSGAAYKDYLKSRINWFSPEDENTFIELSFDLFRDNLDPTLARTYNYRVLREWQKSKNGTVTENFQIYEDDRQLDLDPSFWQDFIEDIIPQGVVNLFFFDGEKIQDLAEGGNTELKKSIKALLNLDIMSSLNSDLEQIKKKSIEKDQDKDTKAAINSLRNDIDTLTDNHKKYLIERGEIQQSLSAIKNTLRNLEKDLKSEGGEYYKERDKLNGDKSICETEISALADRISRMCGEHIPFMLSPKLIKKVNEKLKREVILSEKEVVFLALNQKKNELETYLKSVLSKLKIEKSSAESIQSKVSGFTDSWIQLDSNDKRQFEFSAQELRTAIECLDSIFEKMRELDELYEKIEVQNRKLKRIKDSLNRAIDNDKIRLIHEKMNRETLKLGSKEKELELKDKEIDGVLKLLKDSNKKLEKLFNEADKAEDAKVNLSRIENIQMILNLFEKELTSQKIQHLEDEILNCYGRIHRKTGFIRNISINPETFEVTLFDKSNKPIPVAQMSAGEKQVYAISILWALSKISGRALPMIIDTPLGRLDSSHRENLVNNFFPYASHQVVILSTDTEIDQNYFEDLESHLSHTYNIDFNLDNDSSSLSEGYFFEQRG